MTHTRIKAYVRLHTTLQAGQVQVAMARELLQNPSEDRREEPQGEEDEGGEAQD